MTQPPAATAPTPPATRTAWQRWGRRLKRLLLAYVFLCCIAGIVLMFRPCANFVLLHATTRWIDTHGGERRFVPFRGGQLAIIVARSPGCAAREPEAFDLELMGNGSRAENVAVPVAQRWGDRPVEVWALNYPAFGQSTGPNDIAALPAAGLAAYDALAPVAAGRPILLGSHSMGTTVALYVATQRPVTGMVLLNPPPLRRLILGHYGWWNLWLGAAAILQHLPPQLDSLANGAKLNVPAVFISCGDDHVVPPRYHRMVYDAYAGPKHLIFIPGEGHNYFPDPRTSNDYKMGLDWLWPQPQLHPSAVGSMLQRVKAETDGTRNH